MGFGTFSVTEFYNMQQPEIFFPISSCQQLNVVIKQSCGLWTLPLFQQQEQKRKNMCSLNNNY